MAKPQPEKIIAPASSGPAREGDGGGAAPTVGRAPQTARAVSRIQELAPESPSDVIEWGNGEETKGAPDGGASEPRQFATEPPESKPAPKPDEPAPDAPAEEPAETAAEKRARGLAALGAERRTRTLEGKLKEAQDQIAAGSKKTIGELLKERGVNKDDLLEQLLTGKDDLGLPAKLEGDAAVLADVKKRLDDAEKKLKDSDDREAKRRMDDGLRVVSESLKDNDDVPLVNSYPGAHGLVMETAYQAWINGGQDGSALDYLPGAAASVEAHLRKENPRLAALADAAKKGKTPASAADVASRAEAFAPAPRSIGRRPASRPNAEPKPLPLDMHERDEQIKREYGWK